MGTFPVPLGRFNDSFDARFLTATAVISTPADLGNRATPTVTREGLALGKYVA